MIFNSLPDFRSRIIDNERLVLTECLGQGAFGKVYCAVDRSSPSGKPKVYAVKCLRKPKSGSRQEQHQMREFALHERVSAHPNIVTFHKVIYEKDFVFVVLDYCDGGDLFSAITEQQLFDKNDRLIRRLFVQLIDAVHFCHDNNVCHRDLKPENILCSKDGRSVYLADFGLSTSQRYSTEYGCGSKFYMSPECIGKDVRVGRYSNRQSDVWSLGVIFINMVTGRNPWGFAETKDECFAEY
ncbi:Pkinase-domain-containing protein, partial [Fistulina hepatica ATCC 64428]